MKTKSKLSQARDIIKNRATVATTFICKHPVKFAFIVLVSLAGLAATIKLITLVIGLATVAVVAVSTFFDRYFISIVTVIILGFYLLNKLDERKDKQEARRRAEAERLELARQEAIREKARTADATYTKLAKVIWDVSRGLEKLGILSPNLLSDIYSSGSRMLPIQDGAVMLALFTIQKSGYSVDTNTLKLTMQEKINKKLAAGELPGINREVSYNNRISAFTTSLRLH